MPEESKHPAGGPDPREEVDYITIAVGRDTHRWVDPRTAQTGTYSHYPPGAIPVRPGPLLAKYQPHILHQQEEWLTTSDVQRIAKIKDPKAARAHMRRTGRVTEVGGRLRIPRSALEATESVETTAPVTANGGAPAPAAPTRSAAPLAPPEELPEEWWEEDR